MGGARRWNETEGSASGPERRLRRLGSRQTRLLASTLPRLRASGGRGRRRGTGKRSEGESVAGGKERTGENRPERREGGKMADRFSRFNEDRDFQVNTGVAEDPGKALAEPEPFPPPLPALFPSRVGSGSRTGSPLLTPQIAPGASLRRGRLSARPIFSSVSYAGCGLCGVGPERGPRPARGRGLCFSGACQLSSPGKRGLGREGLERVLLRRGSPHPWVLLAPLCLRVVLPLSSSE